MIQSLVVYSFLGVAFYFLGKDFALRNNKTSILKSWQILLVFALFCFFSGVRWSVGVDHIHYYENYMALKKHGWIYRNTEYLFESITRIFAFFDLHFAYYFAFLAFLQIFFIYYSFKNFPQLLPFIGLLIMLGSSYLAWMNGIRQYIAVTIFVFSIKYIFEKSVLKYLITITVASLIHQSAFLLFPFYFLSNKPLNINRFLQIFILIVCILIGFNPYWINSLHSLAPILELIGYDGYANNLDYWVEHESEITSLGPRRISVLLLSVIILLYSKKLQLRFKNTPFLIYYKLFFLGVCLSNLLVHTNHIFLRPIFYLDQFFLVINAYLLYYLFKIQRTDSLFSFFLKLFVMIISISWTFFAVFANMNLKGETVLYKFFWDFNIGLR